MLEFDGACIVQAEVLSVLPRPELILPARPVAVAGTELRMTSGHLLLAELNNPNPELPFLLQPPATSS